MPTPKNTISVKREPLPQGVEVVKPEIEDEDLIGEVEVAEIPRLRLSLGDDVASFATTGTVPQWMFLKLAYAQKRGVENDVLAVLYEMFQRVVTPEDFPELEDYLSRHAFEYEELFDALGDVIRRMTGHPLDGSSDSSDTSTATAQK